MDTKPSNKIKYIVPTVLGASSLIASLGIIISLHSKQINLYTDNAAATISKWTQEGMKEEALDRSIQLFTKIKLHLSSMLTGEVITFLIQMGIAIATNNWIVDGKNLNDIAEIIAILYYDAFPAAKIYINLIWKDIASAAFVILSLGAFYFIVRKKINWREQLLYGSCLCPIILFLSIAFVSENKSWTTNSRLTPIEKYDKMDADLKMRIIKAGSGNRISKENIFIMDTKEINASATSGLRFKYIFINTGILEVMNADQLMGVVYHEIGHVINNHIMKSIIVYLAYFSCMFVVVVFGYRKLSKYYNGLTAWVLLNAIFISSYQIYMHYYMIHVSQKHEYEADYNAYAKEGYSKSLIESAKVFSLLDGYGTLFDYEDLVSRFITHPSWYKRISAAREHDRNK